jgi:hypothetical protein
MTGVSEFDTFGAWLLERLTRAWSAAGQKPSIVGEHVAGVREQRERAGQHAADRFGHHEDRREREHRDEAGAHRAGATPWTRRGLVTVPVSAVMRMVVTVGVAAPRRRRTVGRAA